MTRRRDFDGDRPDDELPLDSGEEARLARALKAALQPQALDPGLHERILARALTDPLAPPTPEEREAAERLRAALDGGVPSEHSALIEALRFAHGAEGARADAALEAHARALQAAAPKRSNVVYAFFGAVSGVLALAAAFVLVLTPLHERAEPKEQRVELARSRSLAPVVDVEGERLSPSARMDRIANARERDLRNNRYARWGVR